ATLTRKMTGMSSSSFSPMERATCPPASSRCRATFASLSYLCQLSRRIHPFGSGRASFADLSPRSVRLPEQIEAQDPVVVELRAVQVGRGDEPVLGALV